MGPELAELEGATIEGVAEEVGMFTSVFELRRVGLVGTEDVTSL